MARYAKTESVGSIAPREWTLLPTTVLYCGILGHCVGHFGGPGTPSTLKHSFLNPKAQLTTSTITLKRIQKLAPNVGSYALWGLSMNAQRWIYFTDPPRSAGHSQVRTSTSEVPKTMAKYPTIRESGQHGVHCFRAVFGQYCLCSLFWDIGPYISWFWALGPSGLPKGSK